MLTTIKVRAETRDELKLLAALRKQSMVDVAAELVSRALVDAQIASVLPRLKTELAEMVEHKAKEASE